MANSKLVRRRYANVKIPEALTKELDKVVKTHEYRTRADVVRYAIGKFIEEREKIDKTHYRKAPRKKG